MEYFLRYLYEFVGKTTADFIKENCYIAGGSVYSVLTNKEINDIDIYFKSREAMIEFFCLEDLEESYIPREFLEINEDGEFNIEQSALDKWNYFDNSDLRRFKWNKALEKSLKMNLHSGFDIIYSNQYAGSKSGTFMGFARNEVLTFPKSITYKVNEKEFQFVLRFCGEPVKAMEDTFDFLHVKVAYDLKTQKFIYCEGAMESIMNNKIEYVNSYYPLSSLKRLFKYSQRGMYFDNDTLIKVLKDINKLDLDNELLVLDQLSGYYNEDLIKKEEN